MNNLANSYSDLGRHDEALEMREKTLEFRRRVLPENHPSIGEGDAVLFVIRSSFFTFSQAHRCTKSAPATSKPVICIGRWSARESRFVSGRLPCHQDIKT